MTSIGGCKEAEIQTFIPETREFEVRKIAGMLELVSLTGNVGSDGSDLYHHTHGVFAYKEDGGRPFEVSDCFLYSGD